MAVVTAIAAAGAALGGSLIAGHQEKQKGKGFRNNANRIEGQIRELERNRQAIPNPYANVKSNITDLSSQMSNAFANLGVATQAAEIQMEQSDIALANALDSLRATGAGGGGATALAQAALQSKKDVSASIESQEANNEKLRAQGQQQLQQQKIQEQQRIQQAYAQADIEGTKFKFGEQEARDIAQLNRLSGQQAQQQAAATQASANQSAMIGAGIGAFGSIVGAGIGG
jgi:hypothetical protein